MIAFGDEGSSRDLRQRAPRARASGLTNRFIIDQHFRQRDRLGRLLTALAYNPFAVGIGLDEDTAAFIGPDETVEVEGSGGVTVVDASDVELLVDGQRQRGPAGLHARAAAAHPGRRRDVQPAHAHRLGRFAAATQDKLTRRTPRMRILDRSVYVGPSLYAHFPGHPPRARPRRRSRPGRPAGSAPPSSTPSPRRCPGLAEHGCSYGEPGGFIRRMREDEGTWLGHVLEHVAIELQNVAGENVTFGKTRGAGRARRLHRRLRVRAARRRHRGRRARPAAALLAAAGGAAPGRHRARGLELARGARRVHPLRPAPRARALTASLVHGRRGARHPVAAAQRPVAGAARPRQVPAAHPGHRHRAHPAHRGRARERQGGDQQDPRHARPAGAAPGAGAERGPGRARRAPHRLPGRDQALQRQPRPRHLDPAHHRRGGRAGLRGGARSTRARSSSRPSSRATTTACWW